MKVQICIRYRDVIYTYARIHHSQAFIKLKSFDICISNATKFIAVKGERYNGRHRSLSRVRE